MNEIVEYDFEEGLENYIKHVEATGCRVDFPNSNELFIDIDSDEQYKIFLRSLEVLNKNLAQQGFSLKNPIESPSMSNRKGRRHIRLTLPFEVSGIERLALQAALGSDPVRELLGVFRWRAGVEEPTLFAEKRS